MSDIYQVEAEARKYADELRQGGKHENIKLFRYQTRANNYSENDKRSMDLYVGYAVQFSTTEAEDNRIQPLGPRPAAKFHDRSIVLFVNGEGIPMDKLWPHGRIIADIAHTEATPMWLGWRSPFEESDKYNPDRQTAGFKRNTPHDRYTVPDGPIVFWHVLLDEVK
jgi:hypothetical protein